MAVVESVGSGAGFALGQRLEAGASLRIPHASHLSLRLASGASLRLAAGSSARLVAASAVALYDGALYLECVAGHGSPLEVRTPLGVVRDVGTRFEVRLSAGALQVRVREGRISWNGTRATASAGQELAVDGRGTTAVRPTPVFGRAWEWVESAVPSFAIEGRSLRSFLSWAAREQGLRLAFLDEGAERLASATLLHGSVAGLSPAEAVAAVLPTTPLAHRVVGGVLQLRVAQP